LTASSGTHDSNPNLLIGGLGTAVELDGHSHGCSGGCSQKLAAIRHEHDS